MQRSVRVFQCVRRGPTGSVLEFETLVKHPMSHNLFEAAETKLHFAISSTACKRTALNKVLIFAPCMQTVPTVHHWCTAPAFKFEGPGNVAAQYYHSSPAGPC